MTPPKKLSSQNPSRSPGFVSCDDIYTLGEFRLRTGLKAAALRQARRDGLRIVYIHGRGFIFGQEWSRYLNAKQSAHSQSQECTDV
jgi:hypothetical protein